jgi:cell division protein FtsW (lipid II flippase)
MIKNIYKSWKTTLIGIVLLATAIAYILINSSPDYIVFSISLATGIAMLFFSDKFIKQLENFITNKSKEV